METMEGSESENTKPYEAGHTEIQSPQMGIHQSLLECSRKPGVEMLNNERTTRTGGILQYPRPIRVVALMRLNRRVRNRTHGGVRGRGSRPSYSIYEEETTLDWLRNGCKNRLPFLRGQKFLKWYNE